jgi:hypothetical protein
VPVVSTDLILQVLLEQGRKPSTFPLREEAIDQLEQFFGRWSFGAECVPDAPDPTDVGRAVQPHDQPFMEAVEVAIGRPVRAWPGLIGEDLPVREIKSLKPEADDGETVGARIQRGTASEAVRGQEVKDCTHGFSSVGNGKASLRRCV